MTTLNLVSVTTADGSSSEISIIESEDTSPVVVGGGNNNVGISISVTSDGGVDSRSGVEDTGAVEEGVVVSEVGFIYCFIFVCSQKCSSGEVFMYKIYCWI